MAYIGREPQIGNYQICDAISVVNAQAAYTMQVSSVNVIPESVNHMIVSLNGVIQKPGSSYTISSSTITFSSNLATGDSIDFIYLLGNVLDLGTPSDSTVTTAKLSGNLVTPGTLDVNGQELILDADADTSITADTDDQIDIKVAGADDFQITANTLTALSGSTIKADTIAETTSANGVAVDGLNIKDGKLNTNDSVVQANITADAINATKIADNAISEEHLDVTAVTGHTAETSIADGDLVLIHDASASALRKMTKANFVAGVGSDFTPNFLVHQSSNQSIATTTDTLLVLDAEIYDSDNTFTNTSGNYKFTAPSNGKYFLYFQVRKNNFAGDRFKVTMTQTRSSTASQLLIVENNGGSDAYDTANGSKLIDLQTNDTVHLTVYHNDSGNRSIAAGSNTTFFGGYKLV